MTDELRVVFRPTDDGLFEVARIEDPGADDTQGHSSAVYAAWSATRVMGDRTRDIAFEPVTSSGGSRFRIRVNGDEVSGHVSRGRAEAGDVKAT
jgi:hypothetical protein